MLFISIQPFSSRRLLAFVGTIVCLSTASCFASATFFVVASTPYDKQMNRIRPALLSAHRGEAGEKVSVALVNHWMGDLRGIPYAYQMEWKTPEEVQSREPADCKGKAVALYQRMQKQGAKNVRLVIGKRTPSSRMTHTWLLWEINGRTFVLDPTFNWIARDSEEFSEGLYVPFYAYSGDKKYRASSLDLYAKSCVKGAEHRA